MRGASAADAPVYRQLWAERDPRVPPHRRPAADGSPTVEQIARRLRDEQQHRTSGLLTVVRKHEGDVIGYCGVIVDAARWGGEPELAVELLARAHGHGYATEAARAVLAWAAGAGYAAVRASVRRWNGPSLRVMSKLDFVDTGRDEVDADHGDCAVFRKVLTRPPDRTSR